MLIFYAEILMRIDRIYSRPSDIGDIVHISFLSDYDLLNDIFCWVLSEWEFTCCCVGLLAGYNSKNVCTRSLLYHLLHVGIFSKLNLVGYHRLYSQL